MSCTFAAPPGTSATIRSISAWLSSTSGSISGVIDAHPSGIPFAGTSISRDAPPTARASSASTGVVNRARTSMYSPTRRIRPISLIASSECPPSSKKWSHRPTRSTPSTSAQISANAVSISPSGAS
jgi:hypothetical protein